MKDLSKITSAFVEEARIKIIRFLALKRATDKENAQPYEEIVKYMGDNSPEKKYSLQAAKKQCEKLYEIGVIDQTRSKSHDSKWAGEYIKFYFVVENVIEIVAILDALIKGRDRDGAIRTKEVMMEEYKNNPSKFFKEGIFGSRFLDIQEQSLDAIRDIAHNYTQVQKDVINWWSALGQFSMAHYYYPWLYPAASFANMASKAYRSIADYAISGLNIAQNNFDAYIDMSKTYSRLVADNVNEMSQMALKTSKMFEPVPVPAPRGSISTKGAGIPLPEEEEYDYLYALKKLRDELTEIVQIALSGA